MLSLYVSFVAETMNARVATVHTTRFSPIKATQTLRNHSTYEPGSSTSVRLFIEDCAEAFLVIAQTPAVPLCELRDFAFT